MSCSLLVLLRFNTKANSKLHDKMQLLLSSTLERSPNQSELGWGRALSLGKIFDPAVSGIL